MAISTSGGSAASRFRPRGTGPANGLGRRDLLVDEGPTEEAATVEETETSTPEPTAPMRQFVRRAQAAQAAVNTILESPSESKHPDELYENETSADASQSSSTVTGLNTSPQDQTSAPRKRGRPASGTKLAVSRASPETTDSTAAFSVTGARARMREIEATAKAMRGDYQLDLAVLHSDYKARQHALQQEYQALSTFILDHTFGG